MRPRYWFLERRWARRRMAARPWDGNEAWAFLLYENEWIFHQRILLAQLYRDSSDGTNEQYAVATPDHDVYVGGGIPPGGVPHEGKVSRFSLSLSLFLSYPNNTPQGLTTHGAPHAIDRPRLQHHLDTPIERPSKALIGHPTASRPPPNTHVDTPLDMS